MVQALASPGGIKYSGLSDVPSAVWIKAYAAYLKNSKQFQVPKWIDVAKTAAGKELTPFDLDYIFTRAASIVRRIYRGPSLGIRKLRKIYGQKKRRGTRPGHHQDAGGKVIRYCMQQLEKMNILEKNDNKMRQLTSVGRKSADVVAVECGRSLHAL